MLVSKASMADMQTDKQWTINVIDTACNKRLLILSASLKLDNQKS